MKTYYYQFDGRGKSANGDESFGRSNSKDETLKEAEQAARENRGATDFKGGAFIVFEEDEEAGVIDRIAEFEC